MQEVANRGTDLLRQIHACMRSYQRRDVPTKPCIEMRTFGIQHSARRLEHTVLQKLCAAKAVSTFKFSLAMTVPSEPYLSSELRLSSQSDTCIMQSLQI